MKVKKRSGGFEDVNLDKITKAVGYACVGLDQVDPYQIAIKTVGGMYDGVTTAELDLLSIQTAIGFIAENPECIEIKEIIDDAKFDFNRGLVESSEKKLQKAIDACKKSITQVGLATVNSVKPFTINDLVPAIEIAISRHLQMKSLAAEVADLHERLETRKVIDRAKGILMAALNLSEPQAFSWIQKAAMDRRLTMKEVAQAVISPDAVPH